MEQVREIEFRAQTVYDGKWVYGFPMHYANPHYDKWTIREPTGLEHDIEPETICEYTGLHDKHGAKIYEGDIIRDVDGLKTVNGVWVDNAHVFAVKFSECSFNVASLYHVSDSIEIIGNIYDTPKLLQESV